MPEFVKKCPLCEHEINHHFDTTEFRGYVVNNRICGHCGLVFQSPRMTPFELDEFYISEYRRIYQGDEGPNSRDLFVQQHRASALLEFIVDTVQKIDFHLDIGCSSGLLLEQFRTHFESRPTGIEPGDAYRSYARGKGLTVYSDIAELETVGEKSFDLISMAHVLEHLSDPVGYLTNLRKRFLPNDGWLLIEVPNLFCHNSFEIAHLISFSKHTLSQTVKRSGYEIVKLEAHGRPLSELLELYLTLLARPGQSDGIVQPEKGVARKRKLGMLRRRVVQKIFPKKAWKQ